MSSGIKVVLFFITISALLGFTQVPIAEGAVSWNGFLKQVGFNPPSVYEVSADGILLEGENFVQVDLLCLDGDWLNQLNQEVGFRIKGDDSLIFPGSELVAGFAGEIFELPLSDFRPRTVIGERIFVEYANEPGDTGAPFDIPFTVTILCNSPSSLMTIGGEWQATDTTALLIGYSVLNMYWIAPIGISIGVGVYLVKRKL